MGYFKIKDLKNILSYFNDEDDVVILQLGDDGYIQKQVTQAAILKSPFEKHIALGLHSARPTREPDISCAAPDFQKIIFDGLEIKE